MLQRHTLLKYHCTMLLYQGAELWRRGCVMHTGRHRCVVAGRPAAATNPRS